MDRLLQTSFKIFPEEDNRYYTVYIIRNIISNLESIKSQTMGKVFD